MKKVISISLGSSSRDHRVETEILGERFLIERRGTDGDKEKAYRLFTELDGEYDAFGLGGIDLYIQSGGRRYIFRDALKLIRDVRKTPVVDGSGLKDTLERRVIYYAREKLGLELKGKKVLIVSAVDRFGMAEAFFENGSEVVIGDLIFALGIPVKIKTFRTLDILARVICPVLTRLPFELVYPTGSRQENPESNNKYARFYNEADIIAGDYHFIRKYMPDSLLGKIIITNTVTRENVKELGSRGVRLVVTTTPELNGRSFGTNVMEGALIALSGKRPGELTNADYQRLLDLVDFKPGVVDFTGETVSKERTVR